MVGFGVSARTDPSLSLPEATAGCNKNKTLPVCLREQDGIMNHAAMELWTRRRSFASSMTPYSLPSLPIRLLLTRLMQSQPCSVRDSCDNTREIGR